MKGKFILAVGALLLASVASPGVQAATWPAGAGQQNKADPPGRLHDHMRDKIGIGQPAAQPKEAKAKVPVHDHRRFHKGL